MHVEITATGDYPFDLPNCLLEALVETVRFHMEKCGLKDVHVEASAGPKSSGGCRVPRRMRRQAEGRCP
jgi:hypothetical protein